MTVDASASLTPSLLNTGLPTPLYHQIYLILRERISRGEIAADETLPGEEELARRLEVSRITIKRALNDLAADGLVTRHRGRGTVVVGRPTVPMIKGSFDTLFESLHIMGYETEVEVLDLAKVPASEAVAKLLELKPGTAVQRATRLRKVHGEPFSHLVTYVPATIAGKFTVKQLSKTPLLELLERAGARPRHAEQWITATAAEPNVATALRVAPGAPLLKIERVMRDKSNMPIEFIDARYRPDRFQYHVKT